MANKFHYTNWYHYTKIYIQVGAKGLWLWDHKTQNLFLYYYSLIIILFSIWTTVNLLLPHLLYHYAKEQSVFKKAVFNFVQMFEMWVKSCFSSLICFVYVIWHNRIISQYVNVIWNSTYIYLTEFMVDRALVSSGLDWKTILHYNITTELNHLM